MKYLVSFAFFAFIYLGNLSAQVEYNLLWSISGNGLDEESYLFGTIHVTDERAFNFSDSVLIAFEKADLLALEVSTDDYMRKRFEERNSENRKSNEFKDAFSEADYEKVRSIIKDRTKFDIDNSDDMNPRLARRLLFESEIKTNSKSRPETMDNYFEFTAARMSKEVIGLEKPGEGLRSGQGFDSDMERALFQFMLYSMDSVSTDQVEKKQATNYYDELIENYSKGNIESFLMEDKEGQFTFYDMKNRNEIMFKGLDTLMQTKQVFCAVGVSHLPGKNGLIEMLKQAGYTLKPVNATFTGLAKTKMKSFEKLEGVRIGSIKEGYSVMMTGQPQTYQLPGGNLSIQVYQDASGGEMIVTSPIPDIFSSEDELLEGIVENYENTKGFVLLEKKEIKHKGKKGYECEFNTPQGARAMFWVFVENNAIYVFAFLSTSAAELNSSKSDFLKSVEIYDLSDFKSMEWEEQELLNQKIKVFAPSPLIKNKRVETDEYSEGYVTTVHQSFAMDRSIPIAVNVWQWLYPPGYIYADLDGAVYQLDESIKPDQNANFTSRDTIIKSGFMGIRTTYSVGDSGHVESLVVQRGTALNYLKVDYVGESTPEIERLLTEWEFLPWEKPDIHLYKNENFEVSFVGETNTLENYMFAQCDTGWVVASTDYSSGISTDLTVYQFSEYAYFVKPDTLIELLIPEENESLTIVERDSISNNGFTFRLFNSISQLRTFALVKWGGDKLYRLDVNIPIDADSTYADSIHKSFKILNQTDFDCFTSKKEKLLKDLQSTDTATFNSALSVLADYYFEKSDFESLYSTLYEGIPLDSGKWQMRNYFSTMIPFIQSEDELAKLEGLFKMYPKYQSHILAALQDSKSVNKLNLYRRLLTEKSTDYFYSDFSLYFDSIQYLKEDINSLIEILESDENAEYLTYALTGAFQQDTIDVSGLLNPYREFFDKRIRLGIDTLERKSKVYIPTYSLCNDLSLALYAGNTTKDYAGLAKKMVNLKIESLAPLYLFINLANGDGIEEKQFDELTTDLEELDNFLSLIDESDNASLIAPYLKPERLAQYEVEITLYYEDYYDYGNVKHEYSFNHKDENKNYRVEVFTYYDSYSEMNSTAFSVFTDNSYRAVYTSVYLEETEDLEAQKQAIIKDFEEYY